MKHFKSLVAKKNKPGFEGHVFPADQVQKNTDNIDKMSGKEQSLTVFAPMKINLALHILGKRADGYHDLESLVVFSAQGDKLHLEPAKRDSFYIDGAYGKYLSKPYNNLVLRARNSLRMLFGTKKIPPVAIYLTKNLPVAAGLGGGSADAAAVLVGLYSLNGLGASPFAGDNRAIAACHTDKPGKGTAEIPPDLMRLATELGADVPMCVAWFYRRTAFLASAKGEALKALPYFPALALVVVNHGVPLSTRTVFAELAQTNRPFIQSVPAEQMGLKDFAEWAALLSRLRNDLYPPALRLMPDLADILALLKESGAAHAAMSGSGASCFGLYQTKEEAETGAEFIRRRHPDYFVSAVVTDGATVLF